ncbi:transmembrane protein, putative (macronuclear) [Tetrahymena thermophila SB210]|uniref:Transmembrane protein, putative n=1 Tax=Tetrahymena thermophila (strain SB210) TaxID=312017 RepID=Q24IK9_TETTS|nr:transmembrane protein, putative [Tetrahymena thermophila SB210]EAS07616.1 transmembrane protein, putative [Tetrahymena thermophila SB210]|eukprot:XP_001027858.1 transmembrane protein, putative [Tetrahymena thermophila SB210]
MGDIQINQNRDFLYCLYKKYTTHYYKYANSSTITSISFSLLYHFPFILKQAKFFVIFYTKKCSQFFNVQTEIIITEKKKDNLQLNIATKCAFFLQVDERSVLTFMVNLNINYQKQKQLRNQVSKFLMIIIKNQANERGGNQKDIQRLMDGQIEKELNGKEKNQSANKKRLYGKKR